jgi:hypothetical protein
MNTRIDEMAEMLGQVAVCRHWVVFEPDAKGGKWGIYEQDPSAPHTINPEAFVFSAPTFVLAVNAILEHAIDEAGASRLF